MRTPFLLFVAACSLLAQLGPYPGQYPPGQGPSGRNPGNSGPGLPLPSRGSKKNKSDQAAEPASRTFSGVIRKLDAKSFDLELEDTRFLIIQISSQTTKPEDLKVGSGVDAVATEDKDGNFQAVSIKLNAEIAGTINANDQIEPQERTVAPPTILVRPTQAKDDDDAGPPKLKRGKPPARASSPEPQEETTVAALPAAEQRAEKPSPTNARQAFILKAQEVAATFLEGLPNYICQEVITRNVSETRVPDWRVMDVISTEVVYDQGKEIYRNLTINGKTTKKPPEESGAWSTGEFGTILAALFSPGTQASFKYVEDGRASHVPASMYDFAVERLRSAWTIRVPSQYIVPAYKGAVWLDKQSAHALRIEMQAKDIPKEFPLVSAESAVDYDYISLGTPQKFLLPVRAEILSCNRGSNECERNVIEFRNYHKFAGESTIEFKDQ